MKLYFNENFEVVKRDEENIYRGSENLMSYMFIFHEMSFLNITQYIQFFHIKEVMDVKVEN